MVANFRAVTDMQQEVQRQVDLLRNIDEPFEPAFTGFNRPYFSNLENQPGAPPPVSPHQLAQDDHRRQALGQRSGSFRPTVPSHLSITPRRYGSIGAQGGINTTTSSPSSLRYQVAPGGAPPAPPHHPLGGLAVPSQPNLARRHTSADIRIQSWPNNAPPNRFGEYPPPPGSEHQGPSSNWPPSPTRMGPGDSEGQRIRESFSSYSFKSASGSQPLSAAHSSRPNTPPFGGNSNGAPEWNWGGNKGNDRFGGGATLGSNLGTFGANQHSTHPLFKDSALNSGPPTRRGSMAHILNPEETRERDEEEGEREEEDRKRKRLQ